MNRLAFIRRMALAAAACALIDVPWPIGPKPGDIDVVVLDPLDFGPAPDYYGQSIMDVLVEHECEMARYKRMWADSLRYGA